MAFKKTYGHCVMEGCVNDAVFKARRLCAACYSFENRWHDRTTAEKVLHAQKIHRWDIRANVVLVPRKRRKTKKVTSRSR